MQDSWFYWSTDIVSVLPTCVIITVA